MAYKSGWRILIKNLNGSEQFQDTPNMNNAKEIANGAVENTWGNKPANRMPTDGIEARKRTFALEEAVWKFSEYASSKKVGIQL